jgi:hypothetical protein
MLVQLSKATLSNEAVFATCRSEKNLPLIEKTFSLSNIKKRKASKFNFLYGGEGRNWGKSQTAKICFREGDRKRQRWK